MPRRPREPGNDDNHEQLDLSGPQRQLLFCLSDNYNSAK